MAPLFYPICVLFVGGCAFHASSKESKKGEVTPQRALIFETALNDVKDPAKLKALAVAFRKEGLNPQADLLEKRAKLRELPADVKVARREIFRKAMASTNVEAIKAVANAHDKEGATGAANALRQYANSLEKVPEMKATGT